MRMVKRWIDPSFFKDKKVGNLTPLARILFIGLWGLADREGRLPLELIEIGIEVIPHDVMSKSQKKGEEIVLGLLGEIEGKGMIITYLADGKPVIEITNFRAYQKAHPKERSYNIPPSTNNLFKLHEVSKNLIEFQETFCCLNSNSNYNSNSNSNSKSKEEEERKKAQVKEVFDYFCEKSGKELKLTPERKDVIKAKFNQEYTVEQMKKAVDNFVKDDWEGRSKYWDIVYCLGTRKGINNLDRWLEYKPEGSLKEKARGFKL